MINTPRFSLSDRGLLIVLSVTSLIALLTCWYGIRFAVNEILKYEASEAAENWANFLHHDLPGLPEILKGRALTSHEQRTLAAVQKSANIFRYKIFGSDGLVVHATRPKDIGQTNTKWYFGELVRNGQSFVKIEADEDFGKNRVFVSEAYAPVMDRGRFLGAIEVYVDTTDRAYALWRHGNQAFLVLTGILIVIGTAAGIAVATNLRRHKADAAILQQTEERLRQAEKMQSLGTLAGGTAHELNNMLMPVLGLTKTALRDIPEGRSRDNLERVLDTAKRIQSLVKKILSFSRLDEGEMKPTDVALAIRSALALAEASLPATIELKTEIGSTPVWAVADDTQVHQILLNLISNARHAMEGRNGSITVRLGQATAQEAGHGDKGRPDRPYLKLEVADTGCGMDDATLRRIFEPFYTTKAVGEGTGMGLAMIHGIIARHGGEIRADSAVGRGTTFHIFIPACSPAAERPVQMLQKSAPVPVWDPVR